MLLQEALKHATRPHHDQLEQLMFIGEIMDGSLTMPQYKQILNTNYIVHSLLEEKLFNKLGPELKKQMESAKRIKLPALTADMDEAGININSIHTPATIPLFNSEAAALGALYVLEGATLGGSVIVKKLKANTHFAAVELGFHYYQVYGDQLISYWKKFVEVLNHQAEESFDGAIKGATDLFNTIAAVQANKGALV